MTWVGCGGLRCRRGSGAVAERHGHQLRRRAGSRYGAYNLVLNAQGRIQGDLYVWRNGSELDLELEIAADQSEALLRHFTVSSSWTTWK